MTRFPPGDSELSAWRDLAFNPLPGSAEAARDVDRVAHAKEREARARVVAEEFGVVADDGHVHRIPAALPAVNSSSCAGQIIRCPGRDNAGQRLDVAIGNLGGALSRDI